MTPAMSTISGVTASTGSYSYYWMPPALRRENPMVRVAETLGLTAGELRTQLDAGRSLNDIATARGVPHDELITAIKIGLTPETIAAGGADAIAGRIAGKIHPEPEAPPPPLPGAPRGRNAGLRDETKLAGVGRLLGMSAEAVTAAAAGPNALVALLQTRGVHLYALRGVLTSGDLLDVTV
ncbi:hypothetical protein BC793_11777 [Actinoplanes xinjiangensis]|uniref:Uncharacterized protein n=2 Tax=Actinoplanes xinjiangensis TaxID=512350 RepID=A0A316F6Z5_9ACTN|nr:hypothetical protein BC793_11777 [Actinoplanes xinjiangensis]GIF42142.1 hypothetical protein Axi01nite_64530 [Actinoplanes xinjiangensis]